MKGGNGAQLDSEHKQRYIHGGDTRPEHARGQRDDTCGSILCKETKECKHGQATVLDLLHFVLMESLLVPS